MGINYIKPKNIFFHQTFHLFFTVCLTDYKANFSFFIYYLFH
ncbi:hypothetical protein SC09_Contig17orf00065 [Bacillus subtilis]|uniref:Uncharacterized protein n=1 Tax=Bacillus subtilis TaxID=1423 RepID=A0A0D1JK93_BACIU|nr:hypothetical protein SC09_Contig17orf00065 [Bacillus subtilis]